MSDEAINAKRYSAGIATAYGAAVKGGYTGTYAEFCAEQAKFAENAQVVREDRIVVENLVNSFGTETVPAAIQLIENAGALGGGSFFFFFGALGLNAGRSCTLYFILASCCIG